VDVLKRAKIERKAEMEKLKRITRRRVQEGKPNYGLLGNWAIEHFSK